jgi:predicted phosphodiesterase
MRVALLADIHGNALALDVVLAELARDAVDQIVCLGDVVEGGPQPRQALSRLRDLGCHVVMGNTDERMLTDRRAEPRLPDLPPAYAQELWCANQLTDDDRATLSTFMPTVTLALDDTTLLCWHGSPRANTDRIDATTPAGDLDALLTSVDAAIVASGHTHIPIYGRIAGRCWSTPAASACRTGQGHLPVVRTVRRGPSTRS